MVKQTKEIGSEFWDVPVTDEENGLFPEGSQWFLSGRCALQAIISELKGCSSVAVPSWCCDSMIKPFADAGFKINFYPVYWQNGLVQEISLESDVLFLMDYFGYTAGPAQTTGYRGITIRDVTHSLFSTAYDDANYYFGSLRKWCGVWTGGFVWTKDGHSLAAVSTGNETYCELREKAMLQKAEYINGQRTDKNYLGLYKEAEAMLETEQCSAAADRDIELAYRLDAETIRHRRRRNAEVVRTALPDLIMFREMRDTDCPMFVPILVPEKDRDALWKHLISNGIYCPVHWPVSDYHKLDKKEEMLYKNELSLVCDQRYTEKDMRRLVDTIKQYWKEK